MDVEITELEKIDADRVDGVSSPANGIQFIMMKQVAKGQRDCPECGNKHDADFKGDNCEECGHKLPAVSKAADGDMDGEESDGEIVQDGQPCPVCGQAVDGSIVRAHVRHKASKAGGELVECPTCHGDGKIRGNSTKCPDCGAKGKVTPARRDEIMGKGLARLVTARSGLGAAAMLKAVGADGQVDEQPDIELGNQILRLIGQAIGAEASEMAAGHAGEAADIGQLVEAAWSVRYWLDGESAVALGEVMPASALMQSAAAKADLSTKELNDLPDSAFAYIEPGGKKDSEGKTTPRSKRHFAVHDKAHADNAAARIAQGAKFGEEALPKVKAAQKRFGEASSKGVIADAPVIGDTEHGTGSLSKAVEDAIAKATAPLREQIELLSGELAKVKATPVPGGPVLSGNVQVKRPGGVQDTDLAAKAALMREKAANATAPGDRDGYLALARELDEQARKALPSAS